MTSIITGLDIGTSFVRAVIGEVSPDGTVEIIGVKERPSMGLRNGNIINIEATMSCIKQVISDVEQEAGHEVISCVTGIGGSQIESLNSTGQIAIPLRGKTGRVITEADIQRVQEAAKAVQTPMEREQLCILPQGYIVDGVSTYKGKEKKLLIGTSAVRLEAEVHIVTVSKTAKQNIVQCVERAGYQLDNMIVKTLACAQATMDDAEKELGSILIDLGGGTTDVLVIANDAPVCMASIPVGGKFVTNDISIVKGISMDVAEKIKIESGCCWIPSAMEKNAEVLIPGIAGRAPEQISRAELSQIIQPRMEEIFTMVFSEVRNRTSLKRLSGSIILTGGGAQMDGVVELAQKVFGTSSVRVGEPKSFGSGIEENYHLAKYATAVGLVVTYKDMIAAAPGKKDKKQRDSDKERGHGDGLLQKIHNLFF